MLYTIDANGSIGALTQAQHDAIPEDRRPKVYTADAPEVTAVFKEQAAARNGLRALTQVELRLALAKMGADDKLQKALDKMKDDIERKTMQTLYDFTPSFSVKSSALDGLSRIGGFEVAEVFAVAGKPEEVYTPPVV